MYPNNDLKVEYHEDSVKQHVKSRTGQRKLPKLTREDIDVSSKGASYFTPTKGLRSKRRYLRSEFQQFTDPFGFSQVCIKSD